MNFIKTKLSNIKLQEKEVGLSRHLPLAYLCEGNCARTKNGDYLAILKVEGISCEALEDHQLNFEQSLRARLFASLADPQFALYHTIIRSKLKELPEFPGVNPLAKQLHDRYAAALRDDSLFMNHLYLTIVLKGSGSRGNRVVSRFNRWLSALSHQMSQNQAQQSEEEAINLLNEVVDRFSSSLDKYKLRRLKNYQTSTGPCSEILEFYSRILNWEEGPVIAEPANIASFLPRKRLFFGNKAIESQGNLDEDTCFASMLSLKEYPSSTYPGILDSLLQLPIEMVLTQSFAFQDRQQSREALELQLRRLAQSKDPDQKGIATLEEALGDLVAGEFGFGLHHFTAMVLANHLDKLEAAVTQVDKRLRECGLVAIRERLNLEASFWAQFPGNFRYIVRKLPITTDNLASLCSLNNDPPGRALGNHWGEAITVLKTPGNLPYYFNFHPHASDVGHSLFVGMTGSGKTLLVNFLLSAALKHGIRLFYFDKDRGAEIFMRGIGAVQCTLGGGHSAGLNPLQLPDTQRNRKFLSDWLRSLLIMHGEELSDTEVEVIHQAVRLNYEKLLPEQRNLANLASAFGRGGPGSLRNRIDQWHSDGPFAEFFGAEQDQLHLDKAYYCFEMGYLLDKANALVRPSVLLYLFYRIELALDENPANAPTIICLDEAWALLDNPIFAESIKNWLKTFRKRNAMVILLTQEVTDITKASISESINAETMTKVFFPDPNPNKEVYRDIFQLSEREINLLKAYSADRQYFLIKQPDESAVARLDLTGLTEWIPVLSANSRRLQVLHHLLEKQGSNPAQWLEAFMQQASEKDHV